MASTTAPRRMRRTALAALTLVALPACSGTDAATDGADRAAYLTLLGNDTLAVEWMEFGDGYVEASALIRGSTTTFSEYRLEVDESGTVTGWSAATFPADPSATEPTRSERVVAGDDGPQMVTTRNGEEQTRPFEAAPGEVPFVDFLHFPFEFAFRRQAETGTPGQPVAILGGRMTFDVIDNGDGTLQLVHPSRGPSTLRLDADGRITMLDGTGSTRAYDLRRVPFESLDPTTFREMFADRPLGELSGRGEIDTNVAGVNFTGDYGTPQRRGREIFGELVAYGERWRTGANRATHLSFDGDIVVDGTTIPAGDYTLYSIPEAEGGTLIVNRRTGQTGTSYDEAEDQARLEMRRESLDESVEVFEIRVVPTDEGGRIELRWHETVYWVPFTAGE